MKKATQAEATVEIMEMRFGKFTANLLIHNLIQHRFSQKAIAELLLPSQKKNKAEQAASLKHDPVAEFRSCLYISRDKKSPTLFHQPTGAFARAIADVALDIPGATKSRMQRLTSIATIDVHLYGLPRVFMRMVRNSGIDRTPDMRTRAIFPECCCTIDIQYEANLLKQNQILNLLAAAGMIVGIGDWRPQKGGSYGTWELVSGSDATFKSLQKSCGREAQMKALQRPVAFDAESEEILAWFNNETKRREVKVPSDAPYMLPVAINGRGVEASA